MLNVFSRHLDSRLFLLLPVPENEDHTRVNQLLSYVISCFPEIHLSEVKTKSSFAAFPRDILKKRKEKRNPTASVGEAFFPSVGSESACFYRLSALGLGGKNNNNNTAGSQQLQTLDSASVLLSNISGTHSLDIWDKLGHLQRKILPGFLVKSVKSHDLLCHKQVVLLLLANCMPQRSLHIFLWSAKMTLMQEP